MSKVVTLQQAQNLPSGMLRSQAYNALDCTGTLEIANTLLPRLDAGAQRIYALERALQGPAMAMTTRGVRVNKIARQQTITALKREAAALNKRISLDPRITAVWDKLEKVTGACPASTRKDGKHKWARGVEDTPARTCDDCGASRFTVAPFNAGSPDQLKHLFYDLLGVKRQYDKDGKLSADDEAMDKVMKKAPKLTDLVEAIREYRGLKKQIGDLSAKLTPDERFASSFNVGSAWSGRWSSSKNPFGEGRNLQNVAERHRHIFQSDPGWEIFYADLKQAESNVVAHLSGDEDYIAAHEGDTHTFVARLTWPELPWNGDLKKDKKIAQSLYPEWDDKPGHDYRYQAKAVQHGGNLGLTPFGLAIQRHISVKAAGEALDRYFTAFPGVRSWQNWVAGKVRAQEPLVNPFGRAVKLFGRPWDDRTLKQGYAFLPQSTVADIINLSVWRVWRELEIGEEQLVQLLAQVHDAILGQVREGRMDIARRILELMTIPVPITDINGNRRVIRIATEGAIGRNWGKHDPEKNPHGIKEFN